MTDLGRVMLAMEIKAAKMYWQAPQDSQIFPKAYRNVHHTVGIVWADQDQYVTFFGSEDYKIHGIQLLPVTPITNDQFTASFASQDFAEPNNACMSSKYVSSLLGVEKEFARSFHVVTLNSMPSVKRAGRQF